MWWVPGGRYVLGTVEIQREALGPVLAEAWVGVRREEREFRRPPGKVNWADWEESVSNRSNSMSKDREGVKQQRAHRAPKSVVIWRPV